MTPAEILALSNERDQHEARLQAAERAAYLRGQADGYKDGYEAGARLADAQWRRIVPDSNAPSLAEIEARRWGPGGRASFGAARPGDRYPAATRTAA